MFLGQENNEVEIWSRDERKKEPQEQQSYCFLVPRARKIIFDCCQETERGKICNQKKKFGSQIQRKPDNADQKQQQQQPQQQQQQKHWAKNEEHPKMTRREDIHAAQTKNTNNNNNAASKSS